VSSTWNPCFWCAQHDMFVFLVCPARHILLFGVSSTANRTHTMEYDPFIKSQLASRNELEGLMWCKFGHVTLKIVLQRNPRAPTCGVSSTSYPCFWCVQHGKSRPHGGVRPLHQKSTGILQLTLEPCVVQIWSRTPPILGGTKPSYSIVWHHGKSYKGRVACKVISPRAVWLAYHSPSTRREKNIPQNPERKPRQTETGRLGGRDGL